MSSHFQSLFLLLFFLLFPSSPLSIIHKFNRPQWELHIFSQDQGDVPITRYFEVTKPIKLPSTTPCSSLLLHHDFGYTYGKPPVLAQYSPPTHCPSRRFSKVVLEWTAVAAGKQFDRIFGVWLGGVELIRSCTAEPRKTGTIWTVKKDITRYSSLFNTPQTLAVYLGNLVNDVYTGVYHVNLTFHFYPAHEITDQLKPRVDWFEKHADLIQPISRNLPLDDGLWFLIQNSTDTQIKEFNVPKNTYRAVLEVFVSFHSRDETWFANAPNDFIAANNLSIPGNGPFREVVVSLDGATVGAVWPFTVIYTGGVNPLFWRPITGIGSFDLPSYEIEITPFLGKILDGNKHKIGFSVTNGLDVWFIDANLHLWLDKKNSRTKGQLIEHSAGPANEKLKSNFRGLDGTFLTTASRMISSAGLVEASFGKITTHAFQSFEFQNKMTYKKDGNLQIVRQTIDANYGVYVELPSIRKQSRQIHHNFKLHLLTDHKDESSYTFTEGENISLSLNEEHITEGHSSFSSSSLSNLQNGQGFMSVTNSSVTRGMGSTHQVYRYTSNNDCYYRNVTANNYTILYDNWGTVCRKESSRNMEFVSDKHLPFTGRRALLA